MKVNVEQEKADALRVQMSKMVKSVRAKGPMVEIEDQAGTCRLINRREAVERARGVRGMDEMGQDMCDALLRAADEAHRNEHGKGYPSDSMEHIRRDAHIEHKEMLKK